MNVVTHPQRSEGSAQVVEVGSGGEADAGWGLKRVGTMRLLVSVADADDAAAALAGGADVIDAKNPSAGALGAVSLEVLRQIHSAVARTRPVTAALGDASDEAEIELAARAFAAAGAMFVKIGFAGITDRSRVAALIGAATQGARAGSDARRPLNHGTLEHHDETGLIAVAYADTRNTASLSPTALIEVAAEARATGVLLDTADKNAAGLRDLVVPGELATWVAKAHDLGLLVALAGKLTAEDLGFVRDAGADIAGVRGAACDSGRTGRVVKEKVRMLQSLVQRMEPMP